MLNFSRSLLQKPIHALLRFYLAKRIQRLQEIEKNPDFFQEKTWKQVIARNKNTIFGKKHGLDNIQTLTQFKNQIPIQTYEELQPWIQRTLQGESDILCADPIYLFAKSSGTTDYRSKYIPVTENFLKDCHYQGGKDILAYYYFNHPEADLYSGKQLSLGGNLEQNIHHPNPDSYIGDLSALIIQHLPFWAEQSRTPSVPVALMSGAWEKKLEAIAQETIPQDVRSLVGVPSWLLILMKKILQITGKNNIVEVWPNLQLYLHGGVAFPPYQPQFSEILPKNMQYYECFNASEGFFALQTQPYQNALTLMLDYGIFYEFVPLSETFLCEKNINETIKNVKTYTISEVELGKNYALVITTSSGLWRYWLGDTVRFTSLKPYQIQITGRTKQFINVFGEELMVDNAEMALQKTCEETQTWIKEYTVAPIFMQEQEKGGHEWLIEFEKPPENLTYFSQILDFHLQNLNSDYAAKRSYAIDPPRVQVVPEKTFYRWMEKRNKLGGQNKVPRLSNHRNYVEEILKDIKHS